MDKEVAYYSALVNAWIQTRTELDRLLLWLSFGGIVLLIFSFGIIGVVSVVHLFLYGDAILSFILVIVFGLRIFDKNAVYIEEILSLTGGMTGGRLLWGDRLGCLDKLSAYFFINAVLCSIGIGFILLLDCMVKLRGTG